MKAQSKRYSSLSSSSSSPRRSKVASVCIAAALMWHYGDSDVYVFQEKFLVEKQSSSQFVNPK